MKPIHINNLYNDIIQFALEKKFLSRWIVLLIDMVLMFSSSILTYLLVNKVYSSLGVTLPYFKEYVAVVMAASLISFLVFRTYYGIIRYSTIYEVRKIFSALIVSHIIVFSLLYWWKDLSGSITLAYCISSLLISSVHLLGFRLFIVFSYQSFLFRIGKKSRIPLYVYETSPESVSIVEQSVITLSQQKYKVDGFLTFDKNNTSKRISGHPIVYIDPDKLEGLKKLGVKALLFTDENCLTTHKALIEKLMSMKVEVLMVPPLKDVKDMEQPVESRIRSIQIEDLLGRPEINISLDIIHQNIKNKTILVTGAAGSIGSEIVRQIAKFEPKTIVCLDQAETPLNTLELEFVNKSFKFEFISALGDVRSKERMSKIFKQYKPDIVYHAAAYKHVPMMEKDPCESVITNIWGTKNLVDLSIDHSIEMFIMISTDKAVNPTNIMGASKRSAEIYVQSCALDPVKNKSNTKFVTTRFGNVLGSNGSVIPLFRKQIEEGGPITVTDADITRYFMTIPEACRLVLEASVIGESGYIYVFDMGGPVKILDLATKMIKLAGLVPGKDIKIEFCGLRPGEKLYEELLNDEEITQPTSHQKVLIAKVREYHFNEISPVIDQLIHLARKESKYEMVSLMKHLVPEFISKNSEFEFLNRVSAN